MQNNAPNPARLTRSPIPCCHNDTPGSPICADGITIRGNGSPLAPLGVIMDEVVKYNTACLQTTHMKPCFSIDLGEKGIYIPSRYRQIVHSGKASVFTCKEKGYYLLCFTVIPGEMSNATVMMATLWTNDNRSDSGATGHIINKEVQATEPIYIYTPVELDLGQDVWCTLWHDADHPASPKSLHFAVVPMFNQVLTTTNNI